MPLPDDIELLSILHAEIAQRQPEAISLLNRVYHALFNETIKQGCGNCYQKAYLRIEKYNYLLNEKNKMNNKKAIPLTGRKYLLKPGRSIQTTFGGDTLTNDNLTDDAAAKLLKANPALAKHFDRVPVELNGQEAVGNISGVESGSSSSSSSGSGSSSENSNGSSGSTGASK